jgi:hypothetical protein
MSRSKQHPDGLPPHLNLDNIPLTSYHASGGNHKRIDLKALI